MLKRFFLIIYELTQLFLFFLLNLVAIFIKNKKFKLFLKLRSPEEFYKNVNYAKENYKKLIAEKNEIKLFWFHVSSAGEMEQAIPVARKFHDELGAYFFITYYSFSAEPFLKNFPAFIGSSGLPLDIHFAYEKLLNEIPISKLFFVRYDIWPALLLTCKQKGLEINLISATKTKTKVGVQGFISEMWNRLFYKKFNHIFAVSLEDAIYFKNLLPVNRVFLAGDAKWARANERAHSLLRTKNDKVFYNFIQLCKEIKKNTQKKIIVVGSPHVEEHNLILELAVLKEKFFIVYVPHEVESKYIHSLLSSLKNVGYNYITYSDFVNETVKSTETELNLKNLENIFKLKNTFTYTQDFSYNLIVIDKIGLLSEIYQIADASIVGGGFDGQIHNVLEAAAHGVPALFGPSYSRAREVLELIQANAAISFESVNSMFHFLSTWVNFDTEQADNENLSASEAKLQKVRFNALQLFQKLPDTSEVIFNAINKKA